ncbi:MAG: hypothetical protein H0W69_07335 [Gemmatimonadaceae bacterium]|nr:hypothetical protein [Gemmatimonadaceae bacterium]
MRYLSLAAMVAMACSEAPTVPSDVLMAKRTADAAAFRPPPPIDFVGETSAEYSAFTGTYFLNGPGTNGWISFSKQQPAGTSLSSPSARITFHDGTLSGKGTLTLTGSGGILVVDLSTGLSGANLFGSCTSTCGSLDLTGTQYRGGESFGTRTVKANLRNPAYGGGGDVFIGGQ